MADFPKYKEHIFYVPDSYIMLISTMYATTCGRERGGGRGGGWREGDGIYTVRVQLEFLVYPWLVSNRKVRNRKYSTGYSTSMCCSLQIE